MWVEFPKGVWMERNGVLVSGMELTRRQWQEFAANIINTDGYGGTLPHPEPFSVEEAVANMEAYAAYKNVTMPRKASDEV